MKKYFFAGFILVAFLSSCSKETINEKKLAGIWEAQSVQYLFYQGNELIKDSTVANTGALYLYDDAELGNQYRYSVAITPAGFGFYDTWEGNAGKSQTLLGTNIRKLTRRKLELSENITDTSLNVQRTTIYYFERQK